MPLDDAETFSRAIQQHKKAVQDFVQSVQLLGTEKDAAAREKIKRLRTNIQTLEGKISEINSGDSHAGDKAWEDLKAKYLQTKKEYDVSNTNAKKKERQTAATGDRGEQQGRQGGGGGGSGAGEVRIQEIKQIDMSELNTKEAIEKEKLVGALEIESEMRDLKSTYQEFNDLVNHQQTGLDKASSDISQARVHVEKGIVELQEASKHQKSSRKKMCIIIAILIIAMIAIVIVVYFSTR